MNHEQLAKAMCGTYTRLGEATAYLESGFPFPSVGTLIGAYLVDAGGGRLRVTDDGDVLFNIAVDGAELKSSRTKRYREVADQFGIKLREDGVFDVSCYQDELPNVLARYVQAVSAVAMLSLKHRPKEDERFEKLVGLLLERQFGPRVTRRHEMIGISGHVVRFPFAIDAAAAVPTLVQPVPADDGRIRWSSVYEAGGKFKDISLARDVRLVAVLERSEDTEQATRYFADAADVIEYRGGDLPIAA